MEIIKSRFEEQRQKNLEAFNESEASKKENTRKALLIELAFNCKTVLAYRDIMSSTPEPVVTLSEIKKRLEIERFPNSRSRSGLYHELEEYAENYTFFLDQRVQAKASMAEKAIPAELLKTLVNAERSQSGSTPFSEPNSK